MMIHVFTRCHGYVFCDGSLQCYWLFSEKQPIVFQGSTAKLTMQRGASTVSSGAYVRS